jgi:hypothetical protein
MNRWCNMIGLDASSKSLECERSKEDFSLPKISNIPQQPAINNTNTSIQKKQITAINRKVPYKNRTDSTRSQPPIPTNSFVNDLQKKYQTKLTEIDKPNINSSDCISFNGQQRSTKAKRSDQHLSFIQNRVQSVSNGTNKQRKLLDKMEMDRVNYTPNHGEKTKILLQSQFNLESPKKNGKNQILGYNNGFRRLLVKANPVEEFDLSNIVLEPAVLSSLEK